MVFVTNPCIYGYFLLQKIVIALYFLGDNSPNSIIYFILNFSITSIFFFYSFFIR